MESQKVTAGFMLIAIPFTRTRGRRHKCPRCMLLLQVSPEGRKRVTDRVGEALRFGNTPLIRGKERRGRCPFCPQKNERHEKASANVANSELKPRGWIKLHKWG